MRDLVRVSTVFLRIPTYLARTFVKQILYRHKHAVPKMMRVDDDVDFTKNSGLANIKS